ncbi:hypothetical protein NXS98_02970 [Fontisphaera persica]|uniref:hypothetical protein n=1 Tax=Fontisphaera persica TaxID=2974023 RepID=UPI0024BFEB97|nr:hypothetical protein [Fontisphaera persica]WCJ60102.1 hypothetical protein NXS98_02970 [Fontisphaera persica]
MRTILHLVLSGCLLAAACARAAETAAARLVPADALWHIQVDFERLKETRLGQKILTELEQTPLVRVFEGLKVALNFDPRQDLAQAAAFGWEFGENKVVIVAKGKFDAARLQELVTANPEYASEKYGEHLIHGWRDARRAARGFPDSRTFGAVHGQDVVVVAPQAALVRSALEVLDKPALSRQGRKAADPVPGGPFLAASAARVALPNLPPPIQAIVQDLKGLEGEMAEIEGGQVRLTVRLSAPNEETAKAYRDVLQGVRGALTLVKDRPVLNQLAGNWVTSQQGSQASATLQMPVEEIIPWVQRAMNQRRRQGGVER